MQFLAYSCTNAYFGRDEGRLLSMPDPLLDAITRHTNARGGESLFTTVLAGLTLLRADRPKPPSYRVFKPALCIVVQGAKWTTFRNKRFDNRAG